METQSRRAKRLLLCSGGGYEVSTLTSFILALLKNFADDVQVILSPTAAKMTSRYAIEVASRHPVYVEMDDRGPDVYVPHIELSRNVDLILVYPATSTIIGKVANGIADELIPATILAAEVPVIFVPLSNPAMLKHPSMVRNLEQLRADGYAVMPAPAAVEIATREGLAESQSHFPMPTLLVRMAAALSDPAFGAVKRA